MNRDTRTFPDHKALSHAAAAWAADEIRRRLLVQDTFALVLAGGSTPRAFHAHLAGEDLPWNRLHVFWGDERMVPHQHAESNYRMAEETLLRRIPLPTANIHPIPYAEDAAEAASLYDALLRARLGDDAETTFDLVVLGLGTDGHTASLFPGDAALGVTDRWAAPAEAPAGAAIRDRVTLTYPALARSRHVAFLVSGEAKRGPLHAILADPEAAPYPAAHVRARESVAWWVDEAAMGTL